MVQVRLTEALRTQLLADGLDPDILIKRFSDWKGGDEYGSYLFGKDGLGLKSKVLRHVHMVPLHDAEALAKWDQAWRRKPPGRKTSDRYLFYCDGGKSYGFLLIYIVGDPGAHEVFLSTEAALIGSFEKCAEEFVNSGKISN